jgi:hypothetical protein
VGILGAIVKIAVLPMFGTQRRPPLRRTMLYSLSVTITRGRYVNPYKPLPEEFLGCVFVPSTPAESIRGERSVKDYHIVRLPVGSGPNGGPE